MRGKKRFWVMLILIVTLLGGFIYSQLRYYFFNKYNVHAKKGVMKMLNYRYDETFHLISADYMVCENVSGKTKYIYLWRYTFKDDNGRVFYAHLWRYGFSKIDGQYFEQDYYAAARSETYGQLRIEECMPQEYELHKYRQDKNYGASSVQDYLFVCKSGNEEYIAEILTQIFFKEATFSPNGCLRCLVEDENGKELYVYWRNTIKGDLKKQGVEITEEAVQEYILEQLEKSKEN